MKFPVIIDTGFSSTLAMSDKHFQDWAGGSIDDFPEADTTDVESANGTTNSVPFLQGDILGGHPKPANEGRLKTGQ